MATGGSMGRALCDLHLGAHTCTGDGSARWRLRAGLPAGQDMEFVQFHPTGNLRRRAPRHRGAGARLEGGYSRQFGGASASWKR